MTERETGEGEPTRIRHFRFRPAAGGHANDADRLEAFILFDSPEELTSILARLRVTLEPARSDAPSPVPHARDPGVCVTPIHVAGKRLTLGERHSPPELAKFQNTIPGLPHYLQPGWTTVHGIRAYVTIDADEGVLTLDLASGYDVTETDWRNAERLEKLLDGEALNWRPIDGDEELHGP